ncbi:brain protein I3 isoform X1 [Aquila chrysaetos chrysaetos]|uniref:brain protein I3 isoform X1 n=1 Tax=Aquila chrysaetos chrysaetos TaxID=223781 RepID=UPI001B7D2BB5|nr:brain protein I3 isoform X1 [Aquila chrysaetos chrysaetos]
MDNKPLLQERPPAYSPAAQGAGYDYGQSNYGAIPAPQPGFQPPPPYPYPGAAAAAGYAVPPPTSQPNYSSTYTIIQQPATTTSVVVVGGCPACSLTAEARSCLAGSLLPKPRREEVVSLLTGSQVRTAYLLLFLRILVLLV